MWHILPAICILQLFQVWYFDKLFCFRKKQWKLPNIWLYFITPIDIFHTPIFHTPPLASISRLLSSKAFWSIDSSPWRLSCSCQGIQTHGCLLAIKASGKIPILSHHTIFMAQQSHTSTKASLYFFPTYDSDRCGQMAQTRKFSIQSEERAERHCGLKEQLYCATVYWHREREKKTKRQSETEREVKRLPGIIQNSVRNTTLNRVNPKKKSWGCGNMFII